MKIEWWRVWNDVEGYPTNVSDPMAGIDWLGDWIFLSLILLLRRVDEDGEGLVGDGEGARRRQRRSSKANSSFHTYSSSSLYRACFYISALGVDILSFTALTTPIFLFILVLLLLRYEYLRTATVMLLPSFGPVSDFPTRLLSGVHLALFDNWAFKKFHLQPTNQTQA